MHQLVQSKVTGLKTRHSYTTFRADMLWDSLLSSPSKTSNTDGGAYWVVIQKVFLQSRLTEGKWFCTILQELRPLL